jgi:transcriptional regulator with XRE-family HTH domain
MTQNDIARKVFVKHQTISNYEKNTRTCDLNTLVLLSNALDITLDELIKNPHP